jgi:hypothetical protein
MVLPCLHVPEIPVYSTWHTCDRKTLPFQPSVLQVGLTIGVLEYKSTDRHDRAQEELLRVPCINLVSQTEYITAWSAPVSPHCVTFSKASSVMIITW